MESVQRRLHRRRPDFSSKGHQPMLLAQRVKFLVRAKMTQDQIARERSAVRYLAYYDPPDGAPNRQRLRQILDEQVGWAGRGGRGIRRVMMDVDDFSRIHDTQVLRWAMSC